MYAENYYMTKSGDLCTLTGIIILDFLHFLETAILREFWTGGK